MSKELRIIQLSDHRHVESGHATTKARIVLSRMSHNETTDFN